MTKSKTKYMKFRGLVSWAKVYEPDEYLNKKQWKINLHPDLDTIAKIKAAGIQLKLKDSNEEVSGVPGKFFTFTRDYQKQFENELVVFPPPTILDKDNNKLVHYNVTPEGIEQIGDRIIIGNGSLVELDVAIYQTKSFGKGQRFNSVRILDLVEYTPPENLSENEVDEELDDEIPFEHESKPEVKAATPTKNSKKVAW